MIPALRERTTPTWRRLVLVLLAGACATISSPAQATYSIIARDPVTGEIGAAVQSHWFQVHRVIWVEPGVGAVATQSLADFTYGPAGLTLLRLGRGAEEVLAGLLATDAAAHVRQVAILDFDGSIAAHTGASEAYAAGPELRALLPRLPPAGLLTVEPMVVRRLTDATRP
jgi:hypothetical protein